MARLNSGRPSGWYRDPDDPTCVRHWAGEAWSDRRRLRPAWDLPDSDWVAPPPPGDNDRPGPVLEGPIRSTGRSALATAATGRAGPHAVNDLRRMAGAGAGAASIARSGGRSARLKPVATPPMWVGGRRPLMVFIGLTLVALMAVIASVALTRPVPAVPWSLDDPQFITDSNRVCAQSLANARPALGPAMTAGTPTPSASALARWAAAVDQVASRIQLLSSRPDDVGRLNIWLTDWRTYSVDESRYVAWLRHNPSDATGTSRSNDPAARTKGELAITNAVRGDANRADQFAEANQLVDCTLGPPVAPAAQ